MSKGVKTILIIIGIIVVIAILFIGWGVKNFNRAVAMDEQVTAQWAQVENQLKRRYDLIPNLIETVKGYA
ncbi:MAG: LemA family protein, partial [Deltaproteobacteria bacterium]|nr:LemA family protein [Deltaproteobacteria bacterium]